MIVERAAFCHRLKQAREQAGLTLEVISDASKIQRSVLAGLERGDVSRWPTGIFRRAFIREYASAIGLPSEPIVTEFCRLFPEDGGAIVPVGAPPASEGPDGLRLTLAPDSRWSLVSNSPRALAAILDVAIVLAAARLAVQFVPVSSWAITAGIALVYYPLATACAGGTPTFLWLSGRPSARWRRLADQSEKPAAAERPRLVFRRPAPPATSLLDRADADSSAHQNLLAASK